MTVAQVSRKLDVTREAVYSAIRRGRLRATKRGRDYWITPAALRDYSMSLSRRGRPRKEAQE